MRHFAAGATGHGNWFECYRLNRHAFDRHYVLATTANDGAPISFRLIGKSQVTLQTTYTPIQVSHFSLTIADTT
jgi:hypothetical protein